MVQDGQRGIIGKSCSRWSGCCLSSTKFDCFRAGTMRRGRGRDSGSANLPSRMRGDTSLRLPDIHVRLHISRVLYRQHMCRHIFYTESTTFLGSRASNQSVLIIFGESRQFQHPQNGKLLWEERKRSRLSRRRPHS